LILIVFFQLDGALIAMVTNQSIILLIVLWKLREHQTIITENFKKNFDRNESKKLLNYSLMALVSAFTVPVSLMIVRDHIGETLSWDAAGYWQAMTYISSMYLMVVTTALSTYYLPRLSEITEKSELRKELKQGYMILIPIVVVLALMMYVLKDFIVWALFSEDFKAMKELFKWQLIGDVVKISSWLLGMILVAKAHIKTVIISEVIFSISFVFISMFFIDKYSLVGLSYAYCFNYVLHFIFMSSYCKLRVLY
jgi:PST family polysaccharide transporter